MSFCQTKVNALESFCHLLEEKQGKYQYFFIVRHFQSSCNLVELCKKC